MIAAAKHIVALAKGLSVTLKYFFTDKATQQYPEEVRVPYQGYRGIHYFRPGENGEERCVACGLCAAVCPNACIFIEADEDTNQELHPERQFAKRYAISLERCLFCGYCESACPKEAIALSQRFDMTVEKRSDMFWTKEKLLVAGLKVDEKEKGGVIRKVRRYKWWKR